MSTNNTRKSLKERTQEFSVQLPFMEGRDKGDTKELLGTVNTIDNYGFLNNTDGEAYAVFTVKERPAKFYFGGGVLTERLAILDADGYREDIETEGLPMLMTERKSKNNRNYVSVEFYPE